MQEKLLHYIWQNLLFNTKNLIGVDHEPIQIIHRGTLNANAGPDFNNAKIQISNTLWAGSVEIHIKSGDWNLHGHTTDRVYDNTILHVCWEYNIPIYRTDGTKIPCLIIRDKVEERLLLKYQILMESENFIPCSNSLHTIDEFTWSLWKQRLLIERLEHKTNAIFLALEQNKFEWQEIFYRFIARNFGLKINAQPFESLANNLPLKLISRHKNNLLQIEALVFGVAGFLSVPLADDYSKNLQKEYRFLKQKYQLNELDIRNWNFLRLMPANFPTVRLAQFAALIYNSNNLFTKIVKNTNLKAVADQLSAQPSKYWDTHYLFDEPSAEKTKNIGLTSIQNIITNTVVPFKFAFGKYHDDELMKQNALDFLEKNPPESNIIIRKWESLGIKSKNSGQTQALLQLKNEYCSNKLCLDCNIGFKLLKNEIP